MQYLEPIQADAHTKMKLACGKKKLTFRSTKLINKHYCGYFSVAT